MKDSTALPVATITLRILIMLVWVFGTCISALLLFSFVDEPWTMKALRVLGLFEATTATWGMRTIAVLILATLPINYAVFKRMLAMVETVRAGDPFVAENARRLNAIAWLILALELISIAISAIANAASMPKHPFQLDANGSVNGWLTVILTFVLARVFAVGTMMREDLKGTV